MTNQAGASGPSLFQARSSHNHNHQHLHLQHRRLHPPQADTTSPHIRSPPNQELHDRQVVVVQTVSIVHYIDGSGAVTSVQTVQSDPVAPTKPGFPAVVTAALSALSDKLPSVSLSGLIPAPSDGAPSTTSSAESETASPSLSASNETLTSTHFSSSSTFPTLSGVFNSSSTHMPPLFRNHTVGLFSNSTRTSSSARSTFASTSTTDSSSWLSSTTTSDLPTIAAGGGGASANGGAGTPASTAAAGEPTPETPPGLPPATRNAVVGGVVGSVAGIALIVLVLLYLLKWKKQHSQRIMLLDDGDSTARGGGFSSGGSVKPDSGGGMTERSGPFAIPSALAKLSGKRAIEEAPAPAPQERGFYRVSGRKLISVLESGGDGYSDPHDSIGSDTLYYRDSQAFSGGANLPPLQLGSPMRPVSGVVTFRDGPQRTAVQEQGPLPAGFRSSAFPTTLSAPDALGRRLASRDGSRGSGSRFTEDT